MKLKQLVYLDDPLVMTKKRRLMFGILSLTCFVLGLVLSFTYRPYIYAHQVNDFHVADTLGNIVAVPASTFFFYAISQMIPYTRLFVLFVVWAIWGFYEVAISATFDWYDIAANTIICILMMPLLPVIKNNDSN